ncbi:MAG: sulfatase-like hydrolase/transferase [Pirellulaceae bacterium]
MKKPLLLLAVICAVVVCGPPAARAAEGQPPNIVIFLVDDMGVMDTSVPFLLDEAGQPRRYPLNEFYRTPNMERLAAQGIRFNNVCAMSVCSPTRISIMTGQNVSRHRTTNWINPDTDIASPHGPPHWNWRGLKKSDVTLARLLQAHGYRTIHVGKGHFGPRDSEGADPLNLGFDVNLGGASIGAPGSYYAQENFGGGDELGQLAALGVADNTLVFFLGDNGSDAPLGLPHEVACAAPLRGKKGTHYEGGMRVPFIAAWAKVDADHPQQGRLPIPAGSIQTQQASVCDLFPTILHILGIAPPTGHVIDGMQLETLLLGKPDASRAETFLMHYPHAPHRSDYFTVYRDGAWKVVYHYFPTETSKGSHYQLFNLVADPFEQNDLASSRPDELRRTMRGLITALERHQAVYPVNEDGTTPRKPVLP